MIAITHPGKMGDLIFSFPTAMALCRKYSARADFYTSQYCEPLVSLLKYQSWVNEVIIPEKYKIDNHGMGTQPWHMPVSCENYSEIFHLGLQSWPDKDMISFYGEQAGITPVDFIIEAPSDVSSCFETIDDTLVVASCFRSNLQYVETLIRHFNDSINIIHAGGGPRNVLHPRASNKRWPTIIETASIMKQARMYAGGIGVNSVLASAFSNLRVVITHPKKGLATRHVVFRDHITFMTDPSLHEYTRKAETIWHEL